MKDRHHEDGCAAGVAAVVQTRGRRRVREREWEELQREEERATAEKAEEGTVRQATETTA